MTLADGAHHGEAAGAVTIAALAAPAVTAAEYLVLAVRLRRAGRGWSAWRIAAFLAGCGLLAAALIPGLVPGLLPGGAEEDFREHMLQHLLIGMVAPLGLVLAAPVTLLLRAVPPRRARAIGRALHTLPARLLAHPLTVLGLNVGGLAALYFTPLYGAVTGSPVLHHALHLHFVVAGYLFAWLIAGPDPGPHRPSVPIRLVLLGIAITAHAVLAQLMYAGLFVRVPVEPAQLRGAGELMYYGGDIAELMVALAMLLSWRPRRAGQGPPRRAPGRTPGPHDIVAVVHSDR